jgi:hypothetical protein
MGQMLRVRIVCDHIELHLPITVYPSPHFDVATNEIAFPVAVLRDQVFERRDICPSL